MVIIVGFTSCKTVSQSTLQPQKYSAAQLHKELSLLQNILEANHPSLYWYTPKDSIDKYFITTHAALKDSISETDYKNKVAWILSKIKCGHTVVRHSKSYSQQSQKVQSPFFPLSIKIWSDSAVIVANIHRSDSILKRGTIITGINNYTIKKIVDSMFSLMSTDGNSLNFKYQVISFNFPAYYRNAFGLDSQYIIHYIDSLGNKNHKVINNFYPKVDTGRRSQIISAPFRLTRKERKSLSVLDKRSMQIDTALQTAIFSINTFSDATLQKFYRQSFKTIRKNNIKNVMLDLRQNSGGNILSSKKLTQYLADKPFKIADTVAAISRKFAYKQHIKPWLLYWLSMHLTGRKLKDNRIHFRYFERHYFKPKTKNHFDGQVYIVAGGYTFSAATLVTGALVHQKNVILVGEETGGGAYGNTAMHLPSIILPTTGLRVTLPLYRIVVNNSLPKNGRGIMPDVAVYPSSYLIKQAVDGKMQKVRELIIAEKAKSAVGLK